MPAATAMSAREQIHRLTLEGLSAAEVARRLALPDRTVRRLAARCRNLADDSHLAPASPPGRPLESDRCPLLERCLALRRANPGWGAGRIRLEMIKSHFPASVPPRAPSRAGSKTPV